MTKAKDKMSDLEAEHLKLRLALWHIWSIVWRRPFDKDVGLKIAGIIDESDVSFRGFGDNKEKSDD